MHRHVTQVLLLLLLQLPTFTTDEVGKLQ